MSSLAPAPTIRNALNGLLPKKAKDTKRPSRRQDQFDEDDNVGQDGKLTRRPPLVPWMHREFPKHEIYKPPSFPAKEVLLVKTQEDFKPQSFTRAIRSIEFEDKSDFELKDEHLNAIANVSSKIRKGIRSISYKSENLIKITDAGVEQLVTLCPKLEHIHVENAPMLSDKALSAIFHGCPFIRSIVIGGPEATPEIARAGLRNNTRWTFQGAVEGPALDELQQDKSLAPNLELLDLRNQPFDIVEEHSSFGESITATRRRLYVVQGYGGDHCLFYGGELVDSNIAEMQSDFEGYSDYDDEYDDEDWEGEFDDDDEIVFESEL
ncbi:hypothetical protein QBC41DRAFT_327363 [Cercophora samala]|uniref:Uncharacterized protein n=1 Tax=Cercophora samala TaxID=330535 RepID=A0AA39Z7P2_9PEZI|nr:hypothetical protein QBC41DRAFT_327363 [Cercophora samala]